jgi:hypothetical protein
VIQAAISLLSAYIAIEIFKRLTDSRGGHRTALHLPVMPIVITPFAYRQQGSARERDMLQSKNLDLTFADLKLEIDGSFISDGWVTVFRSHNSRESGESDAVYCALVKNSAVSEAMGSHRWNLFIGSGRPGFIFSFGKERQKAVYSRNCDNG